MVAKCISRTLSLSLPPSVFVGKVFGGKMEHQRYPKQPNWSQKGSQNQPRNLQRHPCGTWSNKYRNKVPKVATPGAHSSTKIDKQLENTIPQNIQKSVADKHDVKRRPKGSQKSLMLQFVRERVTFGTYWFYFRETKTPTNIPQNIPYENCSHFWYICWKVSKTCRKLFVNHVPI